MTITGGKKSLLSHIKLLDANPYTLTKNPYKDLAHNFILYRAAYPIRFDEKTKLINIGKPSLGINIRIYKMTYGDLNCKKINFIDVDNFDLWREIKYYDWVKNCIIKRKISPNFIAPILYKIDSNSRLDWSKLDFIKSNNNPNIIEHLKNNQKKINNIHKLDKNLGLFSSILPDYIKKDKTTKLDTDLKLDTDMIKFNKTNIINIEDDYIILSNSGLKGGTIKIHKKHITDKDNYILVKKEIINIPLQIENDKLILNKNDIISMEDDIIKIKLDTINTFDKEDITIDSGRILVLLTEAPTTNILQWASCSYESHGTIKKMVSTGYHSPKIWTSIIFQLIYALAVLYEKGIFFNNLSLKNNIYIKDINIDPNTSGSWIYKIDNIDYYIPNYGYILVIDSNYADIEIESSLLNKKSNPNQEFKIYGTIYNKNALHTDIKIIKNIIMEQFKNIINPDNFGYTFKINGGSIPSDDIINLLTMMWNDTSIVNIKDYLHKYFREFLHIRLGTPLYKSEKENINLLYRPDFTHCKGKLMVWQKRYQEFEWVIYLDDCPDGLRKEIIKK